MFLPAQMTSLRIFLLLLAGLFGAGRALWAADAPTANAPAPPRGRVVVLGDSITAGYGLDPTRAYPALLQAKIDAAGLPFIVANAGVSGDTTSGGLRRLNWALNPGADVLIIALGGNDGLRGVAPKQTAENLAAMIQRARAKAPKIAVLVAGMEMPGNMGRAYTEEFRALFPKVATAQDATLVPYLLAGVGGVTELNQADLIHPTAAGQQRVAENVWAVLEKVLRERATMR
jgi:acyl-CoA thioesterase I